jgi:putative phosphonate metabolism protein
MTDPRYAIYFVPSAESVLYRLGSSLLGYDCYRGVDVGHPPGLPDDWVELTEAPRRYGFHGTLMAPFRLAPGHDEAALLQAVASFTAARNIATIEPVVRTLGRFIAVVPSERNAALDGLAAECVTFFDRFRAPLGAADRARRQAGLSERQRANLKRWGYPYVFEDFRFHMTLTGPVDEDRRAAIGELLSALFVRVHGSEPVPIDRIVLLRQDGEQRFRVLHEAELAAAERNRTAYSAPS